MPEIVYDYIGGNCPVQAEGTINDVPFYFRARHSHWTMCIGNNPILCDEGGYFRSNSWGCEPFEAGYMPIDEAKRIIQECAEEYKEAFDE